MGLNICMLARIPRPIIPFNDMRRVYRCVF
jgi:hypothetical protein